MFAFKDLTPSEIFQYGNHSKMLTLPFVFKCYLNCVYTVSVKVDFEKELLEISMKNIYILLNDINRKEI